MSSPRTPTRLAPVLAGILFGLQALLAGCANVPTPAPSSGQAEDPAGVIARQLQGHYASSRQAAERRGYYDLHLFVQPIWTGQVGVSAGEHWLYVEQALSSQLEQPFRQRIQRLQMQADGQVVARIYALPGDPLHFAGAHRQPSLLRWIGPDDLIELHGCDLHFTREAADRYQASTSGEGCVSEERGARHASSKWVLWQNLLSIWERGFDAEGAQVWGPVTGPYEYERLIEP